MPLFTGFRIKNDILSQEYSVQAAEESLKRAKENITVAVAQAFLESCIGATFTVVKAEEKPV